MSYRNIDITHLFSIWLRPQRNCVQMVCTVFFGKQNSKTTPILDLDYQSFGGFVVVAHSAPRYPVSILVIHRW